MIGEVIFQAGGKWCPSYVLDCFGNLVRCSAAGNAVALLPLPYSAAEPFTMDTYP